MVSNNEICGRLLKRNDRNSDYNPSLFKLFCVHTDEQWKMHSTFCSSLLSFPYFIFPYTTLQFVLRNAEAAAKFIC